MAASNIPTELREASMAGNLDLKELEDLIRKEDVDTVLTVFPYFYAPTVNSYKRYQAASFAPTRLVAGWDNRTCGFRLCGDGAGLRVENRIPGADANPYLAFAATVAAGGFCIHHQLKPPQLYESNAYEDAALPRVPRTLRQAI